MINPIRVGFWKTSAEPHLPNPEHGKPWEGQQAFLDALARLQFHHATNKTVYRGFSICRCCNARNGHTEYETAEYTWPSGYAHYVSVHNVKPPQPFIDYVMHYGR
jgi:hypothetical protein